MKRTLIVCLILVTKLSLFGQKANIINGIEKGKYKVGFTSSIVKDYSRSFDEDSQFRPIQLTIWYPASEENIGQTLSYRDYVELFSNDRLNAIEDFKRDPIQYGANDTLLNKILEAKTLAIKEAKVESGEFPLILFVPGINEKSYSNALLCEYLASNGYIIASTSYMDAYSSELKNMPTVVLEPQIRDMEFVLAHMREFKNINWEKIGLIGHSSGGSAAVAMTIRNPTIDAVALLDGSFIGNPGIYALKNFNYFDPKYVEVPFLHFISGYWRKKGEIHKDFNNQFYDGLEGNDAYQLDMLDLLHQSFVSDMHLRFDNSGIDYKKFGIDQDQSKTDRSYFLISTVLQAYFDRYLKNKEINLVEDLERLKNRNKDLFDFEAKIK